MPLQIQIPVAYTQLGQAHARMTGLDSDMEVVKFLAKFEAVSTTQH